MERDLSAFVMPEGWFAPFYYRRVNELFDDRFSGNGYYPNDDDDTTDAIVNLQVFLDENRRVRDLEYYKVYDLTEGHGRPTTQEDELNRTDEKKLAKALEECTISTAEEELEQLLKKTAEKALPDGWKIQNATKKAISFSDKQGKEIAISRAIITKAIDISHMYIDIINRKEFWTANRRYLKTEYAEPIMALLSLIDIKKYYNYETLVEQAQARFDASEEKVRVIALLEASESGDLKAAKDELKHIRKNPGHQNEMRQALYNALERKDEEMARLLVSKGIDLNQSVYHNGRWYGIMEFVLKSELDSIFQLCLKTGYQPDGFWNKNLIRIAYSIGRQDYATKLLNAGTCFEVEKEDVEQIGIDTISGWMKYIPNVKLTYNVLPMFYNAGKKAIVRRAITKPSGIKDSETHGYVRFILDTGDIDLMQLYCDQGYPGVPSFPCFYLSNTKCFSHPWTKFYTVGLFADQRAINIFVSHSINACIENRDVKGLAYLLDEMHGNLEKEHMEKFIDVLQKSNIDETMAALQKGDNKNVQGLIQYMLQNVRFVYDKATCYMGREVSPEEMRKHEVVDSAAYQLLIYILEEDNPKYVKMAIDYQRSLIMEPGAFYGVYNAIKESKHKELRDTIYGMIAPAARTIADTWGEPDHFVYDYQVDEEVEEAKAFLKEISSI